MSYKLRVSFSETVGLRDSNESRETAQFLTNVRRATPTGRQRAAAQFKWFFQNHLNGSLGPLRGLWLPRFRGYKPNVRTQ